MKSLPDVERNALALSPEDRARLAVSILASLEEMTESPEALEKLWIVECERRFRELRDGVDKGVPAEAVFADLRKRGE